MDIFPIYQLVNADKFVEKQIAPQENILVTDEQTSVKIFTV